MTRTAPAPRKATNLSLDAALLAEARALGVNPSRAAEAGLAEAVARAKAWRRENAAAIADFNAYVEANGVPLAAFRKF